jgi:hypothetical protein
MKEPGLDGRHRDKTSPKKGETQQKRGDTLNKNLPNPGRIQGMARIPMRVRSLLRTAP